jgi:hypothetical protein
MSRKRKFKFTETDKGEIVLIIFFDIKRIVHKEFILAGQKVNSPYYCDVLRRLRENTRRLHPELWQQRTGCCTTTMHRLTLHFSSGDFDQKQHDCLLHPLYYSVSPIEVKLNGCHFD